MAPGGGDAGGAGSKRGKRGYAPQKYAAGLTFLKQFDAGVFRGEVCYYRKPFYKIRYEDGDMEDLTLKELEFILQHQPSSDK
mmetsp:Transcript_13262/g.18438  ORF Transcript_13262/g.18438 Transcript_13262/m.18438 type:complete len:82 (-) Transcript_13262:205-450(-)